jgi:peptidoglycan/LPS O-acetylase OafA/YrhL
MVKEEIKSLTALRGIAAILVVIHHVALLMLPFRGTAYAESFGHIGQLGMSLFFCLSGFVIFYNYSDALIEKNGIINFLSARVSRLFPLYFIFVLFNFYINYFFMSLAHPEHYLSALPLNLFGIQSWFYGRIGGMPLESTQLYGNVAWSISTELMLYIIFIPTGLIIASFKPGLRRACFILIIGVLGRIILIILSSNQFFGVNEDKEFSHWLIYTSPYGRWFEFMAGMGIADLWLRGYLKGKLISLMGYVSLIYILLSIINPSNPMLRNLFIGDSIYIGYAIAIPFVISLLCLLEKKFHLGFGPLMLVGELSYSIYLMHAIIFPMFRSGWEYAASSIITFSIALFLISLLTYKYIEMPGKKLLRHLIFKK